MEITKRFLKRHGACKDGLKWVIDNDLIGLEDVEFIKSLIKSGKLDWANWLIVRAMDYNQYVSYAIYAAEQVLDIYENKYPDDKRPRLAIKAAKKCLNNPSDMNKKNAYAAAYAAAVAYAAAAYADAAAAAYAYVAAAAAADADADAAAAAYVAGAGYVINRNKSMSKFIKYGLNLLKGKK